MTQTLFDAQTALLTASAAFYAGEHSRLTTDAPLLAAVCSTLADVCEQAALLTTADDATYDRREATLKALSLQYQSLMSARLEARLVDLQFNGVAIDLELVRFYLFGREVIAASKL